jgi:site-specific recombinase XerD
MFQHYLDTIKSANTRTTYARGLSYFADWASDAGVDVTRLRVRDISTFRDHLNGTLSGSSANVYLSSLRAFLRWAAERELVEPSVYQAATVVGNVKTAERLPTVLKPEEVEALLCQPDPATLTGARDLAFVSLLVSSGIRVSEAVNLDLDSIDIAERQARVVGKGDKERVVRFNKRAQAALVHYLQMRGPLATGPVFVNRWDARISVRYMQERVAAYGLALEGGERLHPHTLRHTFATQYLDKTGDLDATRRWLGHERAETTQVYTKLANSRLKAQYDEVMDEPTVEDDLVLELPVRVSLERI